MKHISAFFYLYHYYAVPKEFDSDEAFLAAAARHPVLTLTQLCENGCIAPYFIEEETETARLRLAEPERIHLIEASVMPRTEYHARLSELVCAGCGGCLHYTPPAEGEPLDITGHEKEMTLDGLCLLRAEDGEPYTLIDAADAFWGALLEAEDSVRKPLFDGNLTEAADALGLIYARYFSCAEETLFAVNRSVGQRYLMFGAISTEARIVNRYVISRAPVEITDYWILFDYLPRGISRYEPQPEYDLTETPPTVEFKRLGSNSPRYCVNVYCPPAADGVQTAEETFRYLCAELGEDLLFTRAVELHIDTTDDYAVHRPISDFLRVLRLECGMFAQRRISQEFARPLELKVHAVEHGSRAAAERLSTFSAGLSFELSGREFGNRLAHIIDDWSIPVCTLMLTLPDPAVRERQAALICDEIMADLQRDGMLCLIDIARANEGEKLYIDFLAAAGGEVCEALRDLAPEFSGMNPLLTVRTSTETTLHRVNYRFELLRRIPAVQPVQPEAVR